MSDFNRALGARRRWAVLVAAMAVPAFSSVSFAGDFVFTGTTSSDYNTGTNWDQGTVPGASDRADIAGGLTATLNSAAPAVNTFYLGANTDGPAGLPTTGDDGAHSNTNGNGTLNQTGGSLVVNTWASLGEASVGANTGTGTYNLSGGSFTLHGNDNIAVGQGGTGVFNVSGSSTVQIDSVMNIGRWSGTDTTKPGNNAQGRGNGTVVLGGTSTTTINGGTSGTESLAIGRYGDGTLTLQDNAVLNAAKDISIAFGSSATGVLNQTGGTLNQTGGWFFLGHDGGGASGTYNLSGGTLTIANRFLIGAGTGSTGTVNQTGGTVNVGTPGPATGNEDLSISDTGNGIYNISGGTINANQTLFVNDWNSGNGKLNVSGTAVVNASDLAVSRDDPNGTASSQGLVTQTGGTVNVAGHTTLGIDVGNNSNGNTTGTYVLSGGTLNLGTGGMQLGGTGQGTAAHTGATGIFKMQGGVLDAHSTGITIATGAGSTSAFIYTGGTVRNVTTFDVEAGTLELGGGNPLSLSGDGSHSFTEGSAGTLQVDIVNDSGTKLVTANGAVTLAGLLQLHETGVIPLGHQITILDPDRAISGAFSDAPEGGVIRSDSGQAFQITYLGGDGDNVVLTAVVPEPVTVGLVGLAAAGLLVRRRRIG